MRIAALGDAHLGRSAYSAVTDDGANRREVDFEESFTAAVELSLAESPDVVVWLGDVFDHPRPTYRSFLVVVRALARPRAHRVSFLVGLRPQPPPRAHGVPLVAISGNHDTPRLPGTGNPYRVLAEAFPEFTFAHRMDYERVRVAGTTFHLVPQTRTAEDARACLDRADRERSGDDVNVLVTHPLVTSVERRYPDINEIEVDAADLRSDFVLLGHYHFHLEVKPRVWYAGSTDTFSFGDDPTEPKGIIVVDTAGGTCRHVALDGRRPVVSLDPLPCWGRGPAEVTAALMPLLEPVPEGAVTRIALDGIAPEVYRLLDLHAITGDAGHLLHLRIEPRFDITTVPMEDLPELDSMAERWRAYVSGQPFDGIDGERVARTGAEYLEQAIDASLDSGPE